MTSSNKWLIGLAAGLGALVVVAIVLTLATGGRRVKTYSENTPEGAVQRYLQAVIADDADNAYSYLSAKLQQECPLAGWREQSRFAFSQLDESQVTLKETRRLGDDEFVVTVSVGRVEAPGFFDFRPRDFSFDEDFRLLKQPDGTWRFSRSPWPVFGCTMRDPPAKPAPQPAPLPGQ